MGSALTLTRFAWFPEQASTVAGRVDAVYFFLVAVSAFFSVLIASLLFYFAVKYRRSRSSGHTPAVHTDYRLEIAWSAIPFALTMVMFFWGAQLYSDLFRPPRNAWEVFVVGKQWMWKLQHPDGRREINELHVPVGQPVKLTMTSQDVIHSFFVPAFRVKMDVVPGRYTNAWFEATKAGSYHLFCAEYCGTKHSGMIGRIVVLEPADYARWLEGSAGAGPSMKAAGKELFERFRCDTCHGGTTVRAPALEGLYGRTVTLAGGQTVVADDSYLRESVLEPAKRVVEGYDAVMPTYKGQLNEDDLLKLIAYIRSLGETGPKEGQDAATDR